MDFEQLTLNDTGRHAYRLVWPVEWLQIDEPGLRPRLHAGPLRTVCKQGLSSFPVWGEGRHCRTAARRAKAKVSWDSHRWNIHSAIPAAEPERTGSAEIATGGSKRGHFLVRTQHSEAGKVHCGKCRTAAGEVDGWCGSGFRSANRQFE